MIGNAPFDGGILAKFDGLTRYGAKIRLLQRRNEVTYPGQEEQGLTANKIFKPRTHINLTITNRPDPGLSALYQACAIVAFLSENLLLIQNCRSRP